MEEITPFEYNSQLVVDSRLIAQELGVQHNNFMQLIYNYQIEAEKEFGIYLFQTEKLSGRGRPQKYVLLTEDQANFLLTLVDNTSQSVRLKAKLVKGFSKAKELLKSKINGSYWYKRMGLAMSHSENPLQRGYFCVYLEMMRLFSELESHLGYVVPDVNLLTDEYVVPDISIAKCFNNWLRKEDEISCLTRKEFLGSDEIIDFRDPSNKIPQGGKNLHEIMKYTHIYPVESHGDNNEQLAKGYPNKYRGIFNHYLEEYYIPDKLLGYIKERDFQGVEEVRKNILAMSDSKRQSLSNTLVGRFIQNLLPPSK